MIPKEWRDYKWEFRPLVILAWFLVSPAVVLLLLFVWALPWGWTDAIVWNSSTAPSWVQGIGSLIGIAIAIAVPMVSHRVEQRTLDRETAREMLRVPLEMKELFEELAFYSLRAPLGEDWKDRAYYESRAQLLIARIRQRSASRSGFKLWSVLDKSERSLCDLVAMLRCDAVINKKIQKFAHKQLADWMNEAFGALDDLMKHERPNGKR